MSNFWNATGRETTLQEEAILRAFFSQEDIPEALRKYQALFTYEEEKEEPLGEDFETRILQQIGEAPVAKTVTLRSRLVPLFRAAAIVAIVLTLGNAAQAPRNGDGTIRRMPMPSSIKKRLTL